MGTDANKITMQAWYSYDGYHRDALEEPRLPLDRLIVAHFEQTGLG
jgi:hypothetical protein